jgi:hypothetical protein
MFLYNFEHVVSWKISQIWNVLWSCYGIFSTNLISNLVDIIYNNYWSHVESVHVLGGSSSSICKYIPMNVVLVTFMQFVMFNFFGFFGIYLLVKLVTKVCMNIALKHFQSYDGLRSKCYFDESEGGLGTH